MKKMIAVSSLVSLLVLSCSVPVANNSTQDGRMPHRDFRWSQYAPTGHPSLDFTDLEKEYKSFSTKALSDAYVKRMFNKFIGESNTVQLSRQLEFSRYLKNNGDFSHKRALKNIFLETPLLYQQMTEISEISQKMTSDSAIFGAYVEELSPNSFSTLTEIQAISTIGGRDWEHFTIGTDHYLAVANNFNGSISSLNSDIFKWNSSTSTFEKVQSIFTYGASDWEHFTIGTNHYLAVANFSNHPVTHSVNSAIYKFNTTTGKFDLLQNIGTTGSRDWEYFTIGSDHYAVVINGQSGTSYNLNSVIYKWNGTTFSSFQNIPSSGGYDFKYFTIGSDHYLAVANYYNGSSYNINSVIYKWNGTTFSSFQNILTNGAFDLEYFTIGTDYYLSVTNANGDSKIYKWNGTNFSEFQSFAITNARDSNFFSVGTNNYILFTSPSLLKVYKWNGTNFNEFKSFAVEQSYDSEHFTIGINHYIAVANLYSGSTSISKIYRLD